MNSFFLFFFFSVSRVVNYEWCIFWLYLFVWVFKLVGFDDLQFAASARRRRRRRRSRRSRKKKKKQKKEEKKNKKNSVLFL